MTGMPALPQDGHKRAHHGCDHVFFIGFLGAGKTTVARNLGNMFHRDFVDVDRMSFTRASPASSRRVARRRSARRRPARSRAFATSAAFS